MRRLDWLLAAVIGCFLAGALAAQTIGGAVSQFAGSMVVEQIASPRADSPISAQCPTIFIRRR